MPDKPEGMITVEEFAKEKGIPAEKVIKMIHDGFYIGRKVNESWFISESEVSELNNIPSQEELNNILIVAKRQKALLITFFIYIALIIISVAAPDLKPTFQFLVIPIWIAIVLFMARLSWRVFGKVAAVSLTILSIVPFINLIAFYIANKRASSFVRAGGFKIGFLGADIGYIEEKAKSPNTSAT